ncbi:Antibiotic biosynthesis monooxygenase [Ruminiclostridium papyrosolvens DSM 2782]|uniref:Antibiotic biosynthesis monooxygenase n=1 Tax=Ruminiclostridium papyrosolvens DSM 2782 TaxID=588581 RepID=F1THF6_9FIRM|nr:antibiotic biosynthesis monooxygenase [Ruminiclostridium papyrosolvens]EGD46159.1 Antibiotic biosynthesis monooxygenase [Ruminiclostridium papyrosolvens DSM 2782]WES35942.1 antibiotic biosynthesis monooxygenase [Ruminiclostridium papyrosolvens DSM 2782]
MIVRSWHGIVPIKKAEAFREYLLVTGVAEAKATPGNLAAYIHSQTQSEYEHFFMVSYWQDMESIKAFAGDKPQIAVTYPEDSKFGLVSDPIVLQHEIQSIPNGFPCP